MSRKNALKTIDDATLVDSLLKIHEDYGYWDQDPSVYCFTRSGHEKLGRKMARGAQEVVNRVENGGGLRKHPSLKKIYNKVSKLGKEERRDAHEVYESLRNVKRKPEPKKPPYAF